MTLSTLKRFSSLRRERLLKSYVPKLSPEYGYTCVPVLNEGCPPSEIFEISQKRWREWPCVTFVLQFVLRFLCFQKVSCAWSIKSSGGDWEKLNPHLRGLLIITLHIWTPRSWRFERGSNKFFFQIFFKNPSIPTALCVINSQYKIVIQLSALRRTALFTRARVPDYPSDCHPPSFPVRSLCWFSLRWPLTQWTPWMDNSALQRAPWPRQKPAAGAQRGAQLARGCANSCHGSPSCHWDVWETLREFTDVWDEMWGRCQPGWWGFGTVW